MAEVQGLNRLRRQLTSRLEVTANVAPRKVVVGYTASYAMFVHENLEAFHRVGMAKFLEIPMREKQQEMARIVYEAMKQGKTLEQALRLAGLYLQAQSQALCPVATGHLKASAFTRVV